MVCTNVCSMFYMDAFAISDWNTHEVIPQVCSHENKTEQNDFTEKNKN